MRERHRQGLLRHLATGEGPVLNKRVEMPALRADGTEFPVELAITRIDTASRPVFTAYLRDISERVRTERRRSARLGVTQILAQAALLEDAAPRILQAVCESLGWDIGLMWVLDAQEKVERLIEDAGLRPIRVGGTEHVEVVDGVLRLWFTLAQSRGRRIAFKLISD